MSSKLLLLVAIAFVLIVATFVPRYGSDAIVPIVVATSLVYVGLVLIRTVVSFAVRFRRRNG
ncbi:MAG: hypothetical protein ACC628_02100 [Pirellulaceae bacterium]